MPACGKADAGHSFTRISTSVFTPASTNFALFDPASGTPGNASQTIYVGINSTSSGTNLYVTTNGGISWAQVTGSGTLPSGWMPGHAVLSGGNLFLGYANGQLPNTQSSAGGVFNTRPTPACGQISPLAGGNFGYNGVAADPQNPNTVIVATFDHYSGPDQIWRTVNANAATPSWTSIYNYSTSQNFGFNGFNTTRNNSSAPWTGPFGDGIGNWADAIAINPFNSNQLMYGTGQGIWATDNASDNGTNTQLTAPGSWYFPDYGIEFTSALSLATAPSGTPLFSTEGDINGFAHTTLTSSPANGAIVSTTAVIGSNVLGTMTSIDFAGTNPNAVAAVGSVGTNDGLYSTDDGVTWTAFGSKPSGASGGSVAVTSIGSTSMTIVWTPSGAAPSYSTNNGTSWTTSGGSPSTGGTVIADRINPNDFYYYAGSRVYFSNNAGVTFPCRRPLHPAAASSRSIRLFPATSGSPRADVLYHSTNFGTAFRQVPSNLTSTNRVLAFGTPAPGQTKPTIYVFGTLNNFLGIYRSDDGGSSWTVINDVNHQWGGLIQSMAADPNVFGRVYLAVNSRGVIMGNPANVLPANWIDADIGAPGNPGWATNSVTLSNGTVANQWTVNGGGTGLTGLLFPLAY